MAKHCIFCGSTPVTREHVFPRWVVTELMKDPRGLPRWSSYVQGNGERQWRTNKPLDIVAKTVCKRCNETWMSDIEKAAKVYLAPMLAGTEMVLDKNAMAVISKWITLRALVAVSDFPRNEGADQSFHLFYEHKEPMPRWHVFASTYEGLIPADLEINRFTHLAFRRLGIPIKMFRPSILVNAVIGRLIFKAILCVYPPLVRDSFITRGFRDIRSWDPAVVRMFPSPPRQVTWPTHTVVTDNTILKFYQAGLPEPSLLAPRLGKFLEEHRNEIRPPYGDRHER
jgi:hypothetical protein